MMLINRTTKLPLLTCAYLAEAKPFIKRQHKISLPLEALPRALRQTASSGLAQLASLALYHEKHYAILITGAGKLSTLLALTHVLTLAGEQFTELINIGSAGALATPANTGKNAHPFASVARIGLFYGLASLGGHASAAHPHAVLHKKSFMSTAPEATTTLLTSPIPIGIARGIDMGTKSAINPKQTATFYSKSTLAKEFPSAELIDMEGYWNAALAHQFNKPISALKIISDTAEETPSKKAVVERIKTLRNTLYEATLAYVDERAFIHRKVSASLPNISLPSVKENSQIATSLAPAQSAVNQYWQQRVIQAASQLQTVFYFTENEYPKCIRLLENLVMELTNNVQNNAQRDALCTQQTTAKTAKLSELSEKNLTSLWTSLLSKLKTTALQEKTPVQQKQRYFKLLLAFKQQRWQAVLATLQKIATEAAQYHIVLHYHEDLNQVTISSTVKSYQDWERTQQFTRSARFQAVFSILAGNLDTWYRSFPQPPPSKAQPL